MMSLSNIIYLDNNATTQVDPRVVDAMMPYFKSSFANPSSTHSFGLKVKRDLEVSTHSISNLINSEPEEIIYTSGATESINLVLKGVANRFSSIDCHIITVCTEHKATLDVCQYLESQGYQITYLPVDSSGLIDLGVLRDAIKKNTRLISVMMANNETGVLQPIDEIGKIAKSNEILFHTDATQAFGKIPIDVDTALIDFMSFSAHKIYGPKGIGGLFVSIKNRKLLLPLIHGGGQQYNLRSGTFNTTGIIGLGKAAELAHTEMDDTIITTKRLRDQLESNFLKLPGTMINGSQLHRLPTTSNICFDGIDSDVLIKSTPSVAISNGSACTAALPEPSYVLQKMGLSTEKAFSSVRFSVGKFNTDKDITDAFDILIKKINQQRKFFKVA